MKREFLESLGLEKDIIDQIMTENGKDISREKQKADDLKTQLDTAKDALKGFEGVDVAQLQNEITKLNSDLAAKDAQFTEKIAAMEFDSAVDSALASSGARSAKAVRALLDLDSLRKSKNQSEDIRAALEELKKSDGYLFGAGEPVLNSVADTSGDGGQEASLAAVRAAMGLPAES